MQIEEIEKWLVEVKKFDPDAAKLLAPDFQSFLNAVPPVRHRLPTDRNGKTHHFEIFAQDPPEQVDGYIIANTYADGTLAEVFLRCGLQGTMISGLLDSVSIMISLALQYGIPLDHICDKLEHMRFNPMGYSGKEFKFASSVVDYVARYLRSRYGKGVVHAAEQSIPTTESDSAARGATVGE